MISAQTTHARSRSADRGVAAAIVDWLELFGRERWIAGATVLTFDKRARRRLEAFLSPMKVPEPEKVFRTYAVVGRDGRILTVGYRWKRLREKSKPRH